MDYFIYFVLIGLTTYTDSFLTPYFGAFGFSLLPTVSYVLFFYYFILRKKRIHIPFCSFFLKLIFYTFCVSIVFYLVLLLNEYKTEYFGEDLFVKAVKLLITFTSYVLYIYVIVLLACDLPQEKIYRPFFYVFIFLAVFGYLEFQSLPYAFINLHHRGLEEYYRVRLFCQESSHTASIIELFFVLSMYYSWGIKKSKTMMLITIGCFLLQCSISSSKSLVIVLGVSMIYSMWNWIRNSRQKVAIILVSTVFVFLYYTLKVEHLRESFATDIENYTSTATRITVNTAGYLMGICFPLGTGFGGYLCLLPYFIEEMIEQLPSMFDASEMYSMIHSKTDATISAQSFLAQGCTYWGIVGSILFVRNFIGLFRKANERFDRKQGIFYKTMVCMILINICTHGDLGFIGLTVISQLILFSGMRKVCLTKLLKR